MFYANNQSAGLRFGDILRGFVSATPSMKKPLSTGSLPSFDLHVSQPDFMAVLSPCCSIADKVLLVAPLMQVRPSFFSNPFFREDLTRVNLEIEPEQSLPPEAWASLNQDARAHRLSKGRAYAFLENFVFEQHDLLPPYVVHRRGGNVETRHYMIDFRCAFRIDCEAVVSPENSPIDTKLLELSIRGRSALRQKIAHFYSREPMEDLAA